MTGRRNQGVLHKYLLEAAQDVSVKGVALAERLFVPEPFNESSRADAARRRREKLAVLRATDAERHPLAVLIGELKAWGPSDCDQRVWIKHMPDVPLFVHAGTWTRIERRYAALFEARDADGMAGVRIMMAALIRSRRENTYEIDMASLMLTSEQWIPVEGVHEVPLVQALVDQQRCFIKPLRYDASTAGGFPNVLLLDVVDAPVPLHVNSAFVEARERRAKERAIALMGGDAWVWNTAAALPVFPTAIARGVDRPGDAKQGSPFDVR